MKQKVLIIFTSLCFVLSGCGKDTGSITPTDESNPSISAAPTAAPTAASTDVPAQDTAAPAAADTPYSYSSHNYPNEASYTTRLADLSKLKDGSPVLAAKEYRPDWYPVLITGFDSKNDVFGYDIRSCDVSFLDLSVIEDMNDITFNTTTKWPDKLPEGFDPAQILEYNKNPGLGIRALQEQGIIGTGVGIAIIDQALLLNHEQYKDNLMLYERIHCNDPSASMHGPAVASIAVGKDIGVAPGAKLYYIATTSGHFSNTGYEFDASITADGIYRVLDMNKYLPENEKIRVISISRGYSSSDKGYEELNDAIAAADAQGVFVVTTSTNEYYKNFMLLGMDRDYLDDPDDVDSYKPASWLASYFYADPDSYQNNILVPMGSRTFADCSGPSDYAICRNGGMSWAVPWCAGFYALCCQVKPDITPQEFIDAVNSTAITTKLEHDGKTYDFGKIINPAGVIEALKK